MTILSVVYASAPTDEVIIPTLEIGLPTQLVRVCTGFEDQLLGVNGEMVWFQAGNLQVALPAKSTTGQQTLSFGVWNVNEQAQRYVQEALDSGLQVNVTYREYLVSDKSAPASRPLAMVLTGGIFEGDEVQFEASYQDILNTAWPRERFTSETAPGLRYL